MSYKESTLQSKPTIMTEFTHNLLQEKLIALEQEVAAHKLAMGEAIGKGDEYHDNFAYEQASRDAAMAEQSFMDLRAKLSQVEIIKPRQDIETVGLGNSMIIRFESEPEDEKLTLLGPDDASLRRDWISIDSPLGQSLIGKHVGETFALTVKDTRGNVIGQHDVTIRAILPGDF